jgi:hypothetical protein
MGYLEQMEGQTVYVDSPPFIYLMENDEYMRRNNHD